MDGISWVLELGDKMSDVSTRNADALDKLDANLKKTSEDVGQLERAQRDGAGAAEEHGESLFASVFKAEMLKDAVEELGEKVLELGEEFVKSAVESADFGERTRNALEVITGSSTLAKKIQEDASDLALKAALPLHDTLNAYKELSNAKIQNPEALRDLTIGASELSKLGHMGFSEIVGTFANIGLGGETASRGLTMLEHSGLDVESMAHRLGAGSFAQLRESLTKTPIDAGTGLNAVLLTLQEQTKGVFGALTAKDADTITGSLGKIKTGWEEMLESFNESPEWGDLREDVKELARYFNPATKEGKELKAELHEILSSAEKLFHEFMANKETGSAFFHDVTIAAHAAAESIKAVDALLHIGGNIDALGKVNAGNDEKRRENYELHQRVLRESGQDPGPSMEDYDYNKQVMGAMANKAPHAAKGGHVEDSGLAVIHKGETVVPAGGGGGHSINLESLHVHVTREGHGAGGDEDQEDVALLLAEMPSFALSLLDKLATQMGGN